MVAPIGGGGMISGHRLTCKILRRGIRVYAAEPEQADDAARSFRAGHIIADDAPGSSPTG